MYVMYVVYLYVGVHLGGGALKLKVWNKWVKEQIMVEDVDKLAGIQNNNNNNKRGARWDWYTKWAQKIK